MKFVYLFVWCWEWFGDLLLICWCCIPCSKLRWLSKWLSPHFHLSMSFALYLRHGCGKRMYHFEGRIARRNVYHISRDVSCAVKVTIIEGRVVCRDRCMDRYVPHGSRTKRQRVCITRSNMHHYTWHYISLHCTYLSLVNLISCFADLLIAFLRNLWLINIELVIADI